MTECWKTGVWNPIFQNSNFPMFHSLLIRHIPSHNSLRPSVLSPQKERAIFRERLGAAANFARASANDHFLADCRAMLLPFLRDLIEFVCTNSLVIDVQFTEDVHRELRA